MLRPQFASLFFVVAAMYLLFKAYNGFFFGINPYLGGALLVLSVILFITGCLIAGRIQHNTGRMVLCIFFIVAYAAVLTILLFRSGKVPVAEDTIPRKYYLDSSELKSSPQ